MSWGCMWSPAPDCVASNEAKWLQSLVPSQNTKSKQTAHGFGGFGINLVTSSTSSSSHLGLSFVSIFSMFCLSVLLPGSFEIQDVSPTPFQVTRGEPLRTTKHHYLCQEIPQYTRHFWESSRTDWVTIREFWSRCRQIISCSCRDEIWLDFLSKTKDSLPLSLSLWLCLNVSQHTQIDSIFYYPPPSRAA